MDYKRIYNQLIERGKNRLLEGYKERHHIVPRCLGGTDDRSNLVDLTPEEHYLAHQLLVKIYPNNSGLIKACHIMCVDKNGNRLSNKEFGWIRKKYSEEISKTFKGQTKETSERCKKISNALSGRTAETHDYLKDIGQKAGNKTRGRKKEEYEYLQKLSELNKGTSKHTHEGPKKISEALKGRTKENDESVAKRAQLLQGRTKETHEYLARMAEKKRSQNATNCEGIRRAAEKRRGRTKENDESMKQIARTLSVLNEEQMLLLVELRDKNKLQLKQILKIFNEELGIKISYSTLSNNYNSYKRGTHIYNFDK